MGNLFKKNILILLIIGGVLMTNRIGYAQESDMPGSTLSVESAVICEGIEDHTPVDPGNVFPLSVGKLYCLTKIIGATEELTITHVWYFGDMERARVPLVIKSASWRTYSSKILQPYEIGDWKVAVLDPEGNILKTISFVTTLQAVE